jgi:hypothetical protein
MTWYAQVNDLVGGWIVANKDLPLAEIDTRPEEYGGTMPDAYVIAECMCEPDARRIALLLNEEEADGDPR